MSKVHIAESTHWYTRDGKPLYTVEAKSGSQRSTTLRDARKLNLVPSVTNIIRCAAAPGLERWKLDQMMHAALTLPRREHELEADWIERVWTDSRETAKKASERGTEIHAAIQGWAEGKYPGPFVAHVAGAVGVLDKWIGDRNWKPEVAFSHPLGFGGKVDYSCPEAVVDFKTKEFDEDSKLKTWDEHAMQLAAYRSGLGIPKAKCAIVYVSVTNQGFAKLMEIPEEELERGWKMFLSLLDYWQAKNNYISKA